jgi:hypothetical protein
MSKKVSRGRKTMKGGMWPFDEITNLGVNLVQKTKEGLYSLTGASSTPQQPPVQYTPPLMNGSSSGGRKSKKHGRNMKGGVNAYLPRGLVSRAAPFSGSTAEPRTLVGGKTRRNRKSRKNRRR